MRFVQFIICCLLSYPVYSQSTDDVLNKFYNATGGKEKWESLKAYQTVYAFREKGMQYSEESSFEYPITTTVILRTGLGVHSTSVVNDREAYEVLNDKRKDFEGRSLTDKKESAFFLPLLYHKDFNLDLENLGLKRAAMAEGWNFTSNNNCIAIQRNFRNGKYTIFYFDTVTGYLVQEINEDGSYKTYLKYRDVKGSGFKLPAKILSAGAGFSRTYELVSAEFTKGEKPAFKTLLKDDKLSAVPDSPSSNNAYRKKLALVVGNSDYSSGATLRNPVNDARAMQKTLVRLGFDVIKMENTSLDQLKKAIDNFGRKLQEYEVGLFYYAGHGLQFKGANYLIPVDADLKDEHQVEFDCLSADRVLHFMENATSKVNIIILDACRNNPFERSWRRSGNGQGLAFMSAPTGTLIAYSTSPGSTADDGNGENGLYTESLLRHMNTPNLQIEQLFKRVRLEVENRSDKSQTPWESTSLKGEFCFTCQ